MIIVLQLQDLLYKHLWFVCFQILAVEVILKVEIAKAIASGSSLQDPQLMGHIRTGRFIFAKENFSQENVLSLSSDMIA